MSKQYNAFPILNSKVFFPGGKQKLTLKPSANKLFRPVMNLETKCYEILLVFPIQDKAIRTMLSQTQDLQTIEQMWSEQTRQIGLLCKVDKPDPAKDNSYVLTALDRVRILEYQVAYAPSMGREDALIVSAFGEVLELPETNKHFTNIMTALVRSKHPLIEDLVASNPQFVSMTTSIPVSFAYSIAQVVLPPDKAKKYLQIVSFDKFCEGLFKVVEKILDDKPARLSLKGPPAEPDGQWKIDDFHGCQEAKEAVQKQINRLSRLQSTSQEHAQISDWLDLCFSLPLAKRNDDNTDVSLVKTILDESHYGLEAVKQEVLEHVVVRQHAPKAPEKIMLFDGPPGTGKTIMAEAIAEALGRKLIKISMGSVTEPSQIVGDRRVYLGASIGKLVHSLIRAKTDNLVILLDEIDKIGKSHKGDPTAVLLDALDPKQNHSFVDNYLGFPIDLGNVMFICTSNDRKKIPAPLYDRVTPFIFKDYSHEAKVTIASNYILPKLCKTYNFEVSISEEGFKAICTVGNLREIERTLCKVLSHYIFQYQIYDAEPPELLSKKDLKKFLNKLKNKSLGF